MATIAIHMTELIDETGLTLFLRKTSDGTLLNAGGDALTEDPASSGRFTAAVAEAISELMHVSVTDAGGVVRDGWLPSGGALVQDAYPAAGGGGDATEANQTTIITHLTDIKGAGFDAGTDTLEKLRDKLDTISGGAGSGARTVTVTVDDGTDPLEGATVRLTEGVNTYTATSDVNGQCTFNVDDATYTVAVSKHGYTFAGTTIVVDGDETATYSMTAVAIIPPPSAETSTGVITTYDEEGVAEADVSMSVQMESGPGTAGYAWDRKIWTETSDDDGLVQFVGIVRGATYAIWRGSRRTSDNEAATFTVPDEDSFSIAEVLGTD